MCPEAYLEDFRKSNVIEKQIDKVEEYFLKVVRESSTHITTDQLRDDIYRYSELVPATYQLGN